MGEIRVLVVDDDWFKREHIAQELQAHPDFRVIDATGQDEVLTWDATWPITLDIVIVDIIDEFAPTEVGTDLYSGIAVLEHCQNYPVTTFAVTPHRHHPLVEQRIYQSGADFLYRTWEVNDPADLVAALLNSDEAHRPKPVAASLLKTFGAYRAQTNRAVHEYEQSKLYSKLRRGLQQKALRLPRRAILGFRHDIESTGFDGPPGPTSEWLEQSPRWRVTRDYLLILLGRRDAPSTEHDPATDDEMP